MRQKKAKAIRKAAQAARGRTKALSYFVQESTVEKKVTLSEYRKRFKWALWKKIRGVKKFGTKVTSALWKKLYNRTILETPPVGEPYKATVRRIISDEARRAYQAEKRAYMALTKALRAGRPA